MKSLKKAVALVVLVFCFIMTGSLTVEAAAGCNNGNHIMNYEDMAPRETYSSHNLILSSDETGNVVPVTCKITTVIERYRVICECGAVDNGIVERVIAVDHSYYDCPYAN